MNFKTPSDQIRGLNTKRDYGILPIMIKHNNSSETAWTRGMVSSKALKISVHTKVVCLSRPGLGSHDFHYARAQNWDILICRKPQSFQRMVEHNVVSVNNWLQTAAFEMSETWMWFSSQLVPIYFPRYSCKGARVHMHNTYGQAPSREQGGLAWPTVSGSCFHHLATSSPTKLWMNLLQPASFFALLYNCIPTAQGNQFPAGSKFLTNIPGPRNKYTPYSP
jgi:hypothetical protein